MVDLGGYVIIIVETKDKKIKLYGSPADKEDLEVGDEILEVNGRSLENVTHTEVITHIHQCIRSRTICLRVKRRNKLALDLTTQHSNIQDAFVIAVEQQARDRLEKLSQLKKIKPIDMTMLSHQLSEPSSNELNGLIKEVTGSPIYITSVPELNEQQHNELKSDPPSTCETEKGISTPPHREMAVDVPDTFVPKVKTQPSYPKKIVQVPVEVKQEQPIRLIQEVPITLQDLVRPDLPNLLQNLAHTQELLLSNKNGFNNEDLKPISNLLNNPEFKNILMIYNKIYQMCCIETVPRPVQFNSQRLLQEALSPLYTSTSAVTLELINLCSKINFENILYAYDKITERDKLSTTNYDFGGESIDEMMQRDVVEEDIKIVTIEKTREPLGATVRNEGDSVVIGRIIKGGMAEKYGLVEGDEILEVNGIEMKGKGINDVCDTLSHMQGQLTFLIVPNSRTRGGVGEIMIHVRAQFNYNPKEDIYLPCHELGIEFNKGDILHIINQDDLNWWQAHRDGEEEQLAGLIPSKLFQTQREMLKQNVEEVHKAKKSLLCTGKKRKRVEEGEIDEIPTYEQVLLSYPNNVKRPIILIGPPNIGRHELRQRLIQEQPDRFAAAVPHTTRLQKDNEINGQDYYFIARPQFELDISAGKFIEYGEFEKSYYGTSVESIKEVMNSGKSCVLNLHPQSIEIIRSRGDLKPYIIFIGPASLERLKELRIMRGEAYKEDELIDIIRSANKMEHKYGHLFDFIIVNNELECTYYELMHHINYVECKAQWVPAAWNL